MSRHNRAAVPGRPVSPAAPPVPPMRQPRGAATANALPGGGTAIVSGTMDQLTPMQDEGMRDAAQQSPNLSFNQGGAPVRSSLIERDDVIAEAPKRWRVVEDKDVALNGHRFKLRAGKEIDSANYDIPLLQRYGVKLESIAG